MKQLWRIVAGCLLFLLPPAFGAALFLGFGAVQCGGWFPTVNTMEIKSLPMPRRLEHVRLYTVVSQGIRTTLFVAPPLWIWAPWRRSRTDV